MDQATVFTKTAKGITQVNQRTASLSKDLMKVLKLIDGKSSFSQLMEKAELDKNQLEKALNTLTKDGFARVFQTKKEELDPFGDEDDFDFTAPGKMPAATQRVVPGAANDISELARQHEKAEADRKAKEAAHAAAAAKAKAEAQVRAKLEAEAKARQEAERQAMEQARKAKEAAERAKAEAEAKIREEEARKKAYAEQQAKLTAEQKAKEEAEARRLAELRVKAEREAKALAEARARAEAEAAAKRKAEEAEKAQAEMKARLKDEIESRIRGEMEELLRNEVEEKTREEMKKQILEEARLAAKAELEERLREEREVIERAENEARTRAEEEAKKRAEEEARKRAEAEARAAAEAEARIRAEEEAKRLRAQVEAEAKRAAEAAAKAKAEAEAKAEEEARRLRAQVEAEAKRAAEAAAKAKAESEARAREAAEVEKRLEAERMAKYEAEARAKIEAEEREKRERELAAQIEAERKAKQEAEARARIEARARETLEVDTRARVQAEIEADLEKKAEIEGKAQAKAYMEAKAKAEEEEERRIRDEQARRAREIADVLRTKVESTPDDVMEAAVPRSRRKGGAGKTILVGLVALVAFAIGFLHMVPLRPFAAKVEKAMGEWMKDDVSVGSAKLRLLPSPHIAVADVAIGKAHDAKAASGIVSVSIGSLFGDKPQVTALEFERVDLTQEAVRRIPIWAAPAGKADAASITRVNLRAVTLETQPKLPSFDATLDFSRDGSLKQANLRSPTGFTLLLRPTEKGYEFDGTLRGIAPPFGVPLIADGRFSGAIAGNEAVVPEFELTTLNGKVRGKARATWASSVKLESEFAAEKIDTQQLVANFTKDTTVTGRMDGNFTFSTEGPTLEQLFASPRTRGRFKVTEGQISNLDLVAAMQSDTAGARAGGITKFQELGGELSAQNDRASFRGIFLDGGLVKARGAVDVAPNSNVSGMLDIDFRSKVAQDRGNFAVSGTAARPVLKRGS